MNRLFRSASIWVVSILLLLIVITVNAFMVFETIDDMAALEKRIENTDHIADSVARLHVALLTVESGQRGFLLVEDRAYLEHYTQHLNSIVGKIETVSELRSDSSVQQAKINELVILVRNKLNEMINTVELAKQGDIEAAFSIVDTEKGLKLYQQIEDLFNDIAGVETTLQSQHRTNLNKVIKDSRFNFLISSTVIVLLLTTVFLLMYFSNREHLRHQQALSDQNEALEEKVHQRTLAIQVYSDELARSNRELEDFAFVASHDLQEPLRKIRAFGDRLSTNYAKEIDERGQDFLKRMLNAAERMSTLISDLLEFSRVSTRGKPFVETSLNTVVNAVVDDLEIAIETRNATVNCSALPTIDADPSQMNQLFLNLISNALKFKQNDRDPVVNVYASIVNGSEHANRGLMEGYEFYDIYVEDNGIGFDQEYEDKIFAPFQRLHARSEYEGTGIGLAVCRRIVERHNGTISAISRPGEGATFIITMPTKGEPFGSEAKMELENSHE